MEQERNVFFHGEKGGSVIEAGICSTVSRTQNVPKIKPTETNVRQKDSSDVSWRLRKIGFMMKCS